MNVLLLFFNISQLLLGFPLASISCSPSTNGELDSRLLGFFDQATLLVIGCGVTLDNISNSTLSILPTTAVLTSNPANLSATQISSATDLLAHYLERPQNEVNIDHQTLAV